jgi:ankyrin repeat protein
VDLLLRHEADLDALDFTGRTPLHLAARRGRVDAVKALVAAGADPSRKDFDGHSPMDMAGRLVDEQLLAMLREGIPAVVDDGLDAVEALLRDLIVTGDVEALRSAEVDYRTLSQGDRGIVHMAVAADQPGVARLFVGELGLDPNALDARGMTPLHIACEIGAVEIGEFLIGAGAAVSDARNLGGWTPLHFAANSGHPGLTRSLIRVGAPIDAADGQGWTPMHLAARAGDMKMMRVLAESGASLELTDWEGLTPLEILRRVHGLELEVASEAT